MPGKRRGFVRNALHQTSVTGHEIRVMIDDGVPVAIEPRGEMRFGHRHTNGVRKALPKWTGGRFYTYGMSMLGMSRRLAAPLTKRLDVVERDGISRQKQRRIQQHARVTG